jgi:RNase P subunit RPR2
MKVETPAWWVGRSVTCSKCTACLTIEQDDTVTINSDPYHGPPPPITVVRFTCQFCGSTLAIARKDEK